MNETESPVSQAVPPSLPPADRGLVAPLWHTGVLVAILLALAAYGAYGQGKAPGPDVVDRGSALPLYLSTMAAQWLLLRFVVAGGLRKTGTKLRDLLGERWSGWDDVARDTMIAFMVWAAWSSLEWLVSGWIGDDGAKEIGALLPRGPVEIAAWIGLSLTAGFCEEAIFRGYLQRQFQAMTGSVAAGVLLQALLFGVSHGYQGLRNVIAITVYGALFGALAVWRRSLKPGMILHAWTDVFGGLVLRR